MHCPGAVSLQVQQLGAPRMRMWEQVDLPGPIGLMLALQFQPVIVHLEADQDSFVNYDGVRARHALPG